MVLLSTTMLLVGSRTGSLGVLVGEGGEWSVGLREKGGEKMKGWAIEQRKEGHAMQCSVVSALTVMIIGVDVSRYDNNCCIVS